MATYYGEPSASNGGADIQCTLCPVGNASEYTRREKSWRPLSDSNMHLNLFQALGTPYLGKNFR